MRLCGEIGSPAAPLLKDGFCRLHSPDVEAIVLRLLAILGTGLLARFALKGLGGVTELLVADADEHQFGGDHHVANELAEIIGQTTKKHVLVRFELLSAGPHAILFRVSSGPLRPAAHW